MKPNNFIIGVGDLNVVKKKLVRYEAGEIAHIENVMATETRGREHRRLHRIEETVTEEFERSEESKRDLESTERFEVEQEAQQVIRSDTKFEAGAEVSAGFGPVQIGAYARFSTGQSKEQSNTTSTNYAKEVIERSLNRIVERVRRERITRTIEEFEEKNEHRFENQTGQNQSGIYRFVDKYYRAKVVTYGKRVFAEFWVPEPASFYIFAQRAHLENNILPEEPPSPSHPDNDDLPLQPGDISRENYLALTQEYDAEDIDPPPAQSIVLSKIIAREQQADEHFAFVDTDLEIPEGYEFQTYYRWINFHHQSEYNLTNFLGVRGAEYDSDDGSSTTGRMPSHVSGLMPVGARGHGINSVLIALEIFCQLTPEAFQAWQLKIFRAIMNAYNKKRIAYEEKVAAAQIEQGVKISGKNPEINRQIMIQELKKGCITLWSRFKYNALPLVTHNIASSPPNNYPEIHVDNTMELMEEIQFFEQAPDWDNMTFKFLPYYWARKKTWLDIYPLDDADPLFSDFLRAGVAQVLVPFHLAASEAALYYQLTGHLWKGGDVPLFEDPNPSDTLVLDTGDNEAPQSEVALYNAYIDELRAGGMTDQVDKDVEISADDPDTWLIKVPTSLVWLQSDTKLPTFED